MLVVFKSFWFIASLLSAIVINDVNGRHFTFYTINPIKVYLGIWKILLNILLEFCNRSHCLTFISEQISPRST